MQWCFPGNYFTRKWNYISHLESKYIVHGTYKILQITCFWTFWTLFFLRYFKRSQKQSALQWCPFWQLGCYEDELNPRKMLVAKKKSQDKVNAKSRNFSCLRQREEKKIWNCIIRLLYELPITWYHKYQPPAWVLKFRDTTNVFKVENIATVDFNRTIAPFLNNFTFAILQEFGIMMRTESSCLYQEQNTEQANR